MITHFDTTGFRLVQDHTWQHPHTGDQITVELVPGPLNEPYWLEDLAAMRRKLAHSYGEAGCLIEATPVEIDGVPAVYQLSKFPHPAAPTGQVFSATLYLAKSTCFVVMTYLAEEQGITGMREAQLNVQLGMPKNWVLPHPYDPELRGRLPFHRGDDPAWDTQFPEHPLSRVRAWFGRTAGTIQVDPAFAALPDFVPSRGSD
ncbi:hypothetical protein [Amycolatopsis magusensis]|uniref:Suppressor of fused protein (SUFU) n=1 Tax=Amycolatopsis magusensis TaxID=882444 RepID=A0ABS4PS76_9PSEU|nr:hypothetical protein [Amycolatopsis magusensis]MBP2182158.1 hypothetical protein [Amycolatopsis magusensis]MDI5974569.1 hypothetical protein [Amycolatopsis magusensis]